MRDIGRERLVISMSAVCMLENAYQQTLQYVNDRETFGKPLIKNQEIRHVLADVKVLRIFFESLFKNLFKAAYAPLRLLVDHGIEMYHKGEMDQVTSSICKVQTTEACVEVCH